MVPVITTLSFRLIIPIPFATTVKSSPDPVVISVPTDEKVKEPV